MKRILTRIARSIRPLKRRMEVGGSKHHVHAEAADVLVEVAQHREVLRGMKSSVEDQYADEHHAWFSRLPACSRPAPLHNQVVASRWMRVGGWAFILFESVLTGWLSTIFLVLRAWVAVTVGVAMALILAFAAKGLGTVLLARYSATPVEARDHLIRWIRALTVVMCILLIMLFYVRGSTDPLALRLIGLFGAISALASIVTPTLSGLLFAGCELFGWSGRLVDSWHLADRLDRSLYVVEQAAIRALQGATNERQREEAAELDASDVLAAPQSLYSEKRTTLASSNTMAFMLVTGILVLGALHPQQLVAQASPSTMFVTAPPSAAIYSDGSTSVLDSEFQAAKSELVRVVPLFSRTRKMSSWSLTTWSDDAWTVMPHTIVAWPHLSFAKCDTVRLSEAETLFSGARARRLDQAKAECDAMRASRLERYRRDEDRAVTALASALAIEPTHVPRCTALVDLLQRVAASSSGSIAIVVSDGIESCRAGSSHVIQAPLGVKVVLMLLSPANVPAGGRADHFERRRAEIKRIAPWVIVTPVWGLERAMLGEPPSIAKSSP